MSLRESRLYQGFIDTEHCKLGLRDRRLGVERQILLERYGSDLFPGNFKGYDFVQGRLGASIKSLDLSAVSYMDAGRLASRIERYADQFRNMKVGEGSMWRRDAMGRPIMTEQGRVSIDARRVTERELVVAFGGKASDAQLDALESLKRRLNRRDNFNFVLSGSTPKPKGP